MNCVFLKTKVLFVHTLNVASLGYLSYNFQVLYHPYPQLFPCLTIVCVFVCVRAGNCALDRCSLEYKVQRLCNSRPSHTLRSCGGCKVHVSTLIQTTCHVDFKSQLGCLLVASRWRNLYPCRFPKLRERFKYIYPKLY